jgi:hypothetical protein
VEPIVVQLPQHSGRPRSRLPRARQAAATRARRRPSAGGQPRTGACTPDSRPRACPGTGGLLRAPLYAGTRPAEAINLRRRDCTTLPGKGWGRLHLRSTYQRGGAERTDTGEVYEERQLEHRAVEATREVPAHPELVNVLRSHIARYATGPDGRPFVPRTGASSVALYPALSPDPSR